VQTQLQELKAMGIQAVSVSVLFPVLDPGFYGSMAATCSLAPSCVPYLNFYTNVAKAVKGAGLKLIVDNETLFSNDVAAGWTNMNTFCGSLNWTQYMTARAQMAATIANSMQPDYLVLASFCRETRKSLI